MRVVEVLRCVAHIVKRRMRHHRFCLPSNADFAHGTKDPDAWIREDYRHMPASIRRFETWMASGKTIREMVAQEEIGDSLRLERREGRDSLCCHRGTLSLEQ